MDTGRYEVTELLWIMQVKLRKTSLVQEADCMFTWMKQEGSGLLQKLLRAGGRTACSRQVLEAEGLERCRGDPLDPPYPSLDALFHFQNEPEPRRKKDTPPNLYTILSVSISYQAATMSTSTPKRTLCPMSANPFISALQ